ncbi:MAG: PD-(D/E)XK nuclease family protein, partial [Pyrinomonadaceae bacterium]
ATLLKEEHYFYQVACRATDRLYVTRPLLLDDGSETVASYYIEELQRAIAPDRISRHLIRQSFDIKTVVTASTVTEAATALAHLNEHRFLSNSAIRRIRIEGERAGLNFGPYDGKITNKHLLSLLRKRYGSGYVHSASGLNVFGNCPYKFFLNRLLKLENRPEAALDLSPTDAGHLVHDVLRDFFEKHRGQILSETDLDIFRQEIRQIADAAFDEFERRIPPLNSHVWKIDREMRRIYLDRFLEAEIKHQEKVSGQQIAPAHFEVAFGMTGEHVDPISTNRPLELTRQISSASEKIKIRGQIDRIDVSSDGMLIAYDYKMSTGSSVRDMRAGRDLQIAIYLAALDLLLPGREIAGGGYYIIKDSKRNQGLYRKSCDEYTGLHSSTRSRFPDTEWIELRDEVIAHAWDFVDRMRDGDFKVIPSEGKKTCAGCDFSAICRYEPYRINRKLVNRERRE